jgi:hypothetical protein
MTLDFVLCFTGTLPLNEVGTNRGKEFRSLRLDS